MFENPPVPTSVPALLGSIAALIVALGSIAALVLNRTRKPVPVPHVTIPPSGKPRILIVDDEPGELERMRLTLNGDFECFLHKNAYKAIAEVCIEYNAGRAFDLIIMDCMMSPMTGERIVRIIRLMEMETNIRSPIVYFTRMGRMITKPPGVLEIWRKPENHLDLLAKVRAAIGQ